MRQTWRSLVALALRPRRDSSRRRLSDDERAQLQTLVDDANAPSGVQKYHALREQLDGVSFDSRAEARRYAQLQLLVRIGDVRRLERQPVFELHAPTGERVGIYRADFRYERGPTWQLVVEDVKGVDTPLSRWKRRHVFAEYGLHVELVQRGTHAPR